MEAPAMPMEKEVIVTSQWGEGKPVRIEDVEMEILAFGLWQLGSCPDDAEEDWLEVGCHSSCL